MDGLLESAFQFSELALCAAINSLPLCLMVGLITLVGRRWLSARARFALWTLVLVRMVLPFSVETPFGWGTFPNYFVHHEVVPVAAAKDLSVELSLPVTSGSRSDDVRDVNPGEPASWNVRDVLWLIASLGLPSVSLLLAGWLLATSLQLMRRVRYGVEPTDPRWNDLLHQGRQAFGIRVPIRLRILSNWTTPATLGFFRPMILLPEDAATLSQAEMRHVLWHELAHVKRGDAAWNYLWITARCLHWWNPCFWWTQQCWLAERELACDALVMQHLGSEAGADYGQTLLRFLERLSESTPVPLSIPLPGLVLLLGDKAAVRRRLQALAHPLAIETFWGRWGSFTLLVLLAVMGLTDAAASKVEIPPLNIVTVPAGTEWQFSPPADIAAAELPQITRVYDISTALARLQQDEPNFQADIGIRDWVQRHAGIFPWVDGKPPTGNCVLDKNQLVVRATRRQHEALQDLLSHWTRFGQSQIVVEAQFISTKKDLSNILPTPGGEIISPAPHRELDLLMPSQMVHEVNHSLAGPSFVRVISPRERETARQFLQNDPRTSLEFAPKVTLFSGQSAVVKDVVQRPFVTGLRTTKDGGREPQISMLSEGIQIGLRSALVDDEKHIQLNLQVLHSEILDVEVFQAQMPGQAEAAHVQIPHVRESILKTLVTLSSDDSVLVSPLRRDKQGKLQVYLITPRLIGER